MKTCKICNSQFQPKTSETCCSFECKRQNKTIQLKEWKLKNPEKVKKNNWNYNNKKSRIDRLKEYRQVEKNRIRERASGVRYRERNPDVAKNGHLKRNFNITLQQYKDMLESQNNGCDICGKQETEKTRTGKIKELAVDHCHITGKVRGLLCFRCNSALGKFDDSVDILKKAFLYLEKHNTED